MKKKISFENLNGEIAMAVHWVCQKMILFYQPYFHVKSHSKRCFHLPKLLFKVKSEQGTQLLQKFIGYPSLNRVKKCKDLTHSISASLFQFCCPFLILLLPRHLIESLVNVVFLLFDLISLSLVWPSSQRG